MGDGLIIGGGGSIEVATEDLFDRARRLEEAEAEFHSAVRELARVDRAVGHGLLLASDAPLSAARAERSIDDATAVLASTADLSGQLAASLHVAAAAYGVAEAATARASQMMWAEFGWLAGVVGRIAAPLFAVGAVGVAASAYAGRSLLRALSPDAAGAVDSALIDAGRRVITDPVFVGSLRLGAMSADDVVAGAVGIPRALDGVLGDEGLGVTGLDTVAAGAVGIGATAGILKETPVVVRPTSVRNADPVAGIADRAERIPAGPGQVRIDRYSAHGKPDCYEVYIGGTIDFSPTSTNEPFDLTSNLHGIANTDPGAYRVVREALDAEGVPAGAEIVVTGYSQGGLLGAQLAASGDYDVRGLVTFGAPAGQVPVPSVIPWVAIEHSDDLVPALGGSFASGDAVVVRREAFSGDSIDNRFAVPAHQLQYYRETAAMVDSANESRLVAASNAFDEMGAGSQSVTSTTYRGDRTAGG